MQIWKGALLPVIMVAISGVAFADEESDRAKIVGEWQDPSGGVWSIQRDGESLHLTETQNDKKLSDFACNTMARECDVKDVGGALKVSMWYNGPKLVVQEMRGSKIFRQRFHADGDKLELEIVPIVPDGKPQVVKLERHPQSAAANH